MAKDIESEIIRLFLNLEDNRTTVIAKKLGISLYRAEMTISTYLNKKAVIVNKRTLDEINFKDIDDEFERKQIEKLM